MIAIRVGLFVLVAAMGWPAGSAIAAELPPQFRGVWLIAAAVNEECRKSDWDKHESDGLISVGPKTVEYWETACDVQSAKKSDETTYEVGLTCHGEGMTWQSREAWQVQKIGSRRQLVAVNFARSDERDEAGKRVKGSSSRKISINVYMECP